MTDAPTRSPPPLGLSPEAAALKPPPPRKPGQDASPAELPPETGGPKGPEPTRYGDWQFNGKVTDF